MTDAWPTASGSFTVSSGWTPPAAGTAETPVSAWPSRVTRGQRGRLHCLEIHWMAWGSMELHTP
jgi:hypothetical protein